MGLFGTLNDPSKSIGLRLVLDLSVFENIIAANIIDGLEVPYIDQEFYITKLTIYVTKIIGRRDRVYQ